jgi:hypothetical protein
LPVSVSGLGPEHCITACHFMFALYTIVQESCGQRDTVSHDETKRVGEKLVSSALGTCVVGPRVVETASGQGLRNAKKNGLMHVGGDYLCYAPIRRPLSIAKYSPWQIEPYFLQRFCDGSPNR